MDRNSLPVSKKIRQIKSVESEIVNDNLSDINVINLPNGSRIQLEANDISNIINVGSKVVDTISNIRIIKAMGEERVNQIRAEIEKIHAEADIEIKKIEAENITWNNKFEKKKDLLFQLMDKINQNSDYSDEIKKALIDIAGKIINNE